MPRLRPRPSWREFHVSRSCREKFGFVRTLFAGSGNVVFADFRAVREFVARIHGHPDAALFPEGALSAGQVNAMGLIDEILHHVVFLYQKQKMPGVMAKALESLENELGAVEVHEFLDAFSREFPPTVAGPSGLEDRRALLEESLLLWLANANPAFSPYQLFFGDEALRSGGCYTEAMGRLCEFFAAQPPFGPDQQNLVDMLRSPALAAPHSLSGQLDYIRRRWGFMLQPFFTRLLISLDLIREEKKAAFPGPGPQEVLDFSASGEEWERFSPDADWMAQLVLLAKSAYVWLDQLSGKYGRPVRTLDQIPDAELDEIAARGFTGLWLIGVWERSRASETIKRMCGNPEAMASAYAIYQYRIADDLGGEGAFQDLKERAGRRGIRMAADMVPNHMGIDSPWVAEHPEWFIQLDHPPFPAYRFTGSDLSPDRPVAVFLEDRYYTRQDAAVVFKWIDRRSGQTRFIYHGNDGTNMPWNDTAQLNYLRHEVREAVIQTILEVARRFPVIRFDAAMTLTKRHYQRLWFPVPGGGGDVPSRAGLGMAKEAFDRLMPGEFWRDVVERIAAEAPDTLLLAEAFWLLEGYFVRTLGMHRVYNSAFMNFLKSEENGRFREMLKNVLEFQPEILARFVNFMNNPDEETAATQFGKGDKYFGVCLLLATLPGLPMFGHGQIEGFQEKYGMEYRRAYWQERPDAGLVQRHYSEIFPLLRKRHLFSGVAHFLLFDFISDAGGVNDNVIAFFNRAGGEMGLVAYNNAYERTAGRIRLSVPFMQKGADGAARSVQNMVAEALEAAAGAGSFLCLREARTRLEYIVAADELLETGLRLELEGYQSRVFLEFWQMNENEWGHCRRLAQRLGSRGVASLSAALQEIAREPLNQAAMGVFCTSFFSPLHAALREGPEAWERHLSGDWQERLHELLRTVRDYAGGQADPAAVLLRSTAALKLLTAILASKRLPRTPKGESSFGFSACFRQYLMDSAFGSQIAAAWVVFRGLARMAAQPAGDWGFAYLQGSGLFAYLEPLFRELGFAPEKPAQAMVLVEVLLENGRPFSALLADAEKAETFFSAIFRGPYRRFLFVGQEPAEADAFDPEAFHLLLVLFATVHLLGGKGVNRKHVFPVLDRIISLAQASGYRQELFFQKLRHPPRRRRGRATSHSPGKS